MKRQTKTPDEMACGLECIRTNVERVCVKPDKGQCPRCEQLVGESLECIQQLEAKDAEKAQRIAELEQELAAVKRERDAAVFADYAPVKHSEWVKDGGGFTICKECGCCPADWEAKPDNPSGHPPYCHSCGAKMEVRG